MKQLRWECKLRIKFCIRRENNKICTPNNQMSEGENKQEIGIKGKV